jgi:hypothetical protein
MGFVKKLGALALFFLYIYASENFVLKNEKILPRKTTDKINEIANELFAKTGIRLYIAAVNKMPTKKIVEYEKILSKELTPSFVLLTFAQKDHKVDIYYEPKSLETQFDKEQVLSPYPWSGTIIPLLESHSKNKKAAVEAALLNGFADIAEQIAKSNNIVLNSGFGNTNKNIYIGLKVFFYGTLIFIFINFFYRRFIKR